MSIRTIIVDNDRELLHKLSGILNGIKGIELLGSFGHPAEVIRFAGENQVDLVFSDVVMPDISGITLAARLAELPRPPRVILLSDIPGLSIKTWNIRALGFLPKPYTKADIHSMVELYKREGAGS